MGSLAHGYLLFFLLFPFSLPFLPHLYKKLEGIPDFISAHS